MKREDSDKLKKLFNDVKEISDRLDKFNIAGKVKEIKKIGNSGHILMGNKDIGKKAIVIILSDFKNM